jgi:hypothetical protein
MKPPRALAAYRHEPTRDEARTLPTDPGPWYVCVSRAERLGFLAGPFDQAADASALVDPMRDRAYGWDPWTHFDRFGIGRMPIDPPFPQGVLYVPLAAVGVVAHG